MAAPKLSALTPVMCDNSNGVLQVVTGAFAIERPEGEIKTPQNLLENSKTVISWNYEALPVISVWCGHTLYLRDDDIIFGTCRGRGTSRGCCSASHGTHGECSWYKLNAAVSTLLPYAVLIISGSQLDWTRIIVALDCSLNSSVVLETICLIAHIVVRTT